MLALFTTWIITVPAFVIIQLPEGDAAIQDVQLAGFIILMLGS